MDNRMTKYDKYIFRRDKKEQERRSSQREQWIKNYPKLIQNVNPKIQEMKQALSRKS